MFAKHHTTSSNTLPSLHTPLVDLLGCTYPVICAGMGGVARAQLAAAVSEAGAYGCLGMVRESPQFIRAQIEQYRSLSDKPFAVNIIPAATDTALLQQQVDTLIAEAVPAVCLFWDVRADIIRQFIDAGISVIHQIGTRKDAEQALQAGVDILIAQGIDAGGHVRGAQNVYTLLPEICSMSAVPVVAAGGIATGQGIATAMLLGAQGVCCGSAFLATTESNAHDYHKQRLLQASADDTIYTKAFYINWPVAAPVRVLRSSVTDSGSASHNTAKHQLVPIGSQDGQDVYLYSTDSPLCGASGELDKMALYAGRSCSDITTLCSAAERVQQLVDETLMALRHQLNAEHAGSDTDSVSELNSSPCMANKFSGEYAGHCDNEELYRLLLELLAAERAGAKVCAFSLRQAGPGHWHNLLMAIHRDEVRSCEALMRSIGALGEKPHREVGDFFEKCMAIDDLSARMQLLNKGQAWVVRKITDVLPRVGTPAIFNQLKTMREAHIDNIAATRRCLES